MIDFSIEELAPGVYLHYGDHEQITYQNKGDIANIGFIVGDESVAIIDTGGSKYVGEALRQKVAEVTDLPIRYVILTHAHPDHVFGIKAFESQDAELDIVGHKNLSNALVQRGQFYQQRFISEQGFKADELQLLPQTVFVDTVTEIDLGNRVLTLVAHQTAHTNNDLTVFDEKTKTIWTGDLLFRQRIPVVDGNVISWLATMQQLQVMDVDLIVPGHGTVAKTWAEALDDQHRYLNKLITGIRASLDKGESIQNAVKTVGQDESSNWQLFEDHHGQNVSRIYTELEWE